MSPSAYITTRTWKSGKRYVVRYRRGGRLTPLEHAGSFKQMKDAKARRDFVISELAAGRDPRLALRALAHAQPPATFRQRFDAFIASRVDVAEKTLKLYRNSRDRLGALGELEPSQITAAHVQQWVKENSEGDSPLSPSSLAQYLSSIRQVLDFCEVSPNPARSKLVKLPSRDLEEISPPDSAAWSRIRECLTRRSLLLARLIEAEGLRIGEALGLTYGDVDFAEGRLRVSRARTKRRTAGQRWLPVPAELLDELAELCPLEDRFRERKLFTIHENLVRRDLSRACRDAGVADYSPHDLRHRRISLWVAQGYDPVTVKTWAGHSRASMSLDTYSHVLIDAQTDEWREFWRASYVAERRQGEVWVRSEEADE